MGFGKGSNSINTFAKFDAKQAVFIIKNKNGDGKWVQSGNPESYVDGTVEGIYPRSYDYKGEKKTSFQLILNGSGDPINPDMISIEFNETRAFGSILPCFAQINKGDKITLSAKLKNEFANIYMNDENGDLVKTGYDWHKVMMPMLKGIKDGTLTSFYDKQLKEKFGKGADSVEKETTTVTPAPSMEQGAAALANAFGATPDNNEVDDLPF